MKSMVANFNVPATGRDLNVDELFSSYPGIKVKISNDVRKFLETDTNLIYSAKAFSCNVYEVTDADGAVLGCNLDLLELSLVAKEVCYVLAYLGANGTRGSNPLKLRDRKEVIIVFDSHVMVKGERRVLVLKHKKEHDEEEISLNFEGPDHKEKNLTYVLRIL